MNYGITCGFVDGDLLGATVGLIEGAVEGALLVLSDGDFVHICLIALDSIG